MEKRYNSTEQEQRIRLMWKQEHTYHITPDKSAPLFSIDTPPPTVSGSLHIGHIFSYTQTDIIARYKRMSGYAVFYPFGFDDNGLPTERYVEKQCKVVAHKMERSAFIALCLEQTKQVEQLFMSLWQRIGLSVDWNSCYSTISAPIRKLSQESFIRLYRQGHIYRKYEPALYCTRCRTSVAQAELDDHEQSSFFNDIIFHDSHGNKLMIGTTRPELLPSCVAIFYNPHDTRYQHLKNTQATVPLFNHKVPLLEDTRVDTQKGTGLVMCCTFGDKTDVIWYKTFNLPYRPSIQRNGKFNADIPILAGLNIKDARTKVIEVLRNQQLLQNQRPITHVVNVHERCKKEIEFAMLSQWFLRILDHKENFIHLAEKINWHPAYMKSRYINWVKNIGWDWCLSRQRFYGIPFPVWYCKKCNKVLLADEKNLPIDPQETPYPNKNCPHCNSSLLIPETDVMDTWNTSSLTPYICKFLYEPTEKSVFDQDTRNNFFPMSMRPQAHDIIRTWAFYTIVKLYFHNDSIPWKDIVVSGHVLSKSKEKLSKSKKNAQLSPENLLQRYSADAIRYWTASGGLGNDISFSEMQLKIGQRLITKLWNAFRFIHEHVHSFDKKNEAPANLGAINEWILDKISNCFESYQRHLHHNEFSLSLREAERFFWDNFCDNYLELIKDQLFNPNNYKPEELHATQWTLFTTGLRILQLFAPYIPYVTESLYQTLYRNTENIASLHQTKFSTEQQKYQFPNSVHNVNQILQVVNQVRKLKTEQQLSLKTALANVTISYQHTFDIKQIEQFQQLLKGATHAQHIQYINKLEPLSLFQRDGEWHASVTINHHD